MTTNEKLPMVAGRTPVVRQVDGYGSWIIDDGNKNRFESYRLCGDGQWRHYKSVRNIDICAWPTSESAAAFIRDLAAREQPPAVSASEAWSDVAAPGSILNAVVEMYDAGIVTNSLEAMKILRKHFS